jgi:CHAD domain-containing protein
MADHSADREELRRASVEALCARHGVDLRHASAVERAAVSLFRLLAPWHGLDAAWEPAVAAAARLHNVARRSDPGDHHKAGRAIVVAEGLPGFSFAETAAIALAVGWHRRRVRPMDDPLFRALAEPDRTAALRVAALVRAAVGLDHSHQAASVPRDAHETADGILVRVASRASAAAARQDLARANRKADLWLRAVGVPLLFAGPAAKVSHGAFLHEGMTLREAAERVLRLQHARILAHREGALSGVDPEDVHQMRVAVRRLRSALRLFAGAWGEAPVAPVREEFRWLGALLGGVRDLDVTLAWIASLEATVPAPHRAAVRRLVVWLEARRTAARAEFAKSLATPRAETLLAAFPQFLGCRDGMPEDAERPLRRRARRLAERERERFEERLRHLRALGPAAPIAEIHSVRIAAKRARYAAEFFRGLEPARFAPIAARMERVQETLGVVNDMEGHAARIAPFLRADAKAHRALAWLTRQAKATGAEALARFWEEWGQGPR